MKTVCVCALPEITKEIVEETIRRLQQAETHEIVEEIIKRLKLSVKEKESVRKKVIKFMYALESEGKVSKTRSLVKRGRKDRTIYVKSGEVWIYQSLPEARGLPPAGLNGYYKILGKNEKLAAEAASKALSEWCEETYKVTTEVRVNRGISPSEDLSGKLTLSMRAENINGVMRVKVGSASLPSFNSLSPATYMAELVFHLHGGNFQSGPGAPNARVIHVFPDGSELDMGVYGFAPTWVVSLDAWPDDSSFSLLYHYERLYRSDSLLERLLQDALVESIREVCGKYGVHYTVKWFMTWLHPKVEGDSVRVVGTKELVCAVKNLLSAKRDADLLLNKVKKRLASALIIGLPTKPLKDC